MEKPVSELSEADVSMFSSHYGILQNLDEIGSSLDLTLKFETAVIIEEIYPTESKKLPKYDRGLITRRACLAGLVCAWIAAIVCVVLGCLVIVRAPGHMYWSVFTWRGVSLVSLLVNVFVTLVTDAMCYIHGVSLRWALHREGRLHSNSNVRLLSSSRTHAPNSWPMNLVWFSSLVCCYAASNPDSDTWNRFETYKRLLSVQQWNCNLGTGYRIVGNGNDRCMDYDLQLSAYPYLELESTQQHFGPPSSWAPEATEVLQSHRWGHIRDGKVQTREEAALRRRFLCIDQVYHHHDIIVDRRSVRVFRRTNRLDTKLCLGKCAMASGGRRNSDMDLCVFLEPKPWRKVRDQR